MKHCLNTLLFLFITGVSTLYAQTPFSCTGRFYVTLTQGNNNSSLQEIKVDPVTSAVAFTTIGSGNIGAVMNAIGYRSTDNFIYGINPSNKRLYRLSATGTATLLATLPGLSSTNAYFAGDVTPDGHYLVVFDRVGNNITGFCQNLVKIDLTSPTYATTSVPILLSSTGAANNSVYMADVAFDPLTGVLYGFDNSLNGHRLVTIDINTGIINNTLYPQTSAIWMLGAMFFDPLGNLYGYGRTTQNGNQDDFFFVDKTTGQGTFLTGGPAADGNDGCSCPYTIKLVKKATPGNVGQCGLFNYSFEIVNNSGISQSGINLADTLPTGFTITQVLSNPFGGTATGVGTDILNVSNMTLPLGVNTLVIQVQAPQAAVGKVFNQAILSNLPASLGGTIESDNVNTLQIDDATPVRVNKYPDLGNDTILCVGDTILLNPGNSTGAVFAWNTGQTTPNLLITQSGEYILTANTNGCIVADTINIAFNSVSVNLGNDTTICTTDNLVLDATFPNVTYLWNDGSTNPTLAADEPNTYSVIITDTVGCTAADAITITNYPTVNLGSNRFFRCDSTQFSIVPNILQGNFLWQDGSTNPIFVATNTGTYNVQLTDVNGCQSADTIVLVPPTPANINFGADTILCAGQSITLNAAIPNAINYLWQDGSTNSSFLVSTAGTYYVRAINHHACEAVDTILVLYNDVVVNLGNDANICHNAPITLNATQPNMTYLWQDGSTASTFTVANVGTYNVTLTDTIGCQGSDTILIGMFPITQIDLGADQMFICDSLQFAIVPNYLTGGFLWNGGATSTIYAPTTTGTYSLQYTDLNGCISNDTVILFSPPIPTVFLGNDTILCVGDSLVLNPSEPYTRSLLWQDGSSNLTFTVTTAGNYHVERTDSNGCVAFDTLQVLFNQVIVALRPDTSICYYDSLTITAFQPDKTYLWNTGATSPAITVLNPVEYWVELTDSIGCKGRDTFQLSYYPFANLGNDVVFVCDSLFVPLNPGVIGGTFLWQDGSTNPTFLPPGQGTYWVQITDLNGCFSADTVTLIPVTSPTVDIGQDTNICVGNTVLLNATQPFIRDYFWQNTLGDSTFTATITGLYHVEIVDSNGCSAFDSVNIWVNDIQFNIGADTAICNGSQLLLNASYPNITNYIWSNGSVLPAIIAGQGTYSVTLTDTLGCIASDTIQITYRPIADLGADFSFICDSLPFNLNANIIGNYLWTGGSTAATFIGTQDGTYVLNVTDLLGCFSSDTIVVSQISYPDITLGNDTVFCDGTAYLIDATTPFIRSYLWQDGSTVPTYNITETGTYILEVIDSFGCKTSDTLQVNVNEIIVNLGNDTTVCHTTPRFLNAAQPNNNPTYVWQDGTTNSFYVAANEGTYSVTVTDNIGCTGSDAVVITHFPTIELGEDRLFKCDSSQITLIPNFLTGNFLWQNGSIAPIFVANTTGRYILQYTDANNCTSRDTIEVTTPPVPPINLGNDVTLCENQTLTLSAFHPSGRSYRWQDGSTNDFFIVVEQGQYYAEITDTNGCTNVDTVVIDYFLAPRLNLGNDTTICENEPLLLEVNVNGGVQYEWQDGTQGQTYLIYQAGVYMLTVRDANNCAIQDSIIIGIEQTPNLSNRLPSDTTVCNYTVVLLNAYEPNATSYIWEGEEEYYNQNLPDSLFEASYEGIYTVTIANRCASVEQTIEIIHEDCGCYPFIPNGITPNFDGVNDELKVFANCELLDFNLEVYDRWGNRLYSSNDINVGWNGTFNGQLVNTGVYVWRITYTAINERGQLTEQTKTGDVTVVR